MRDDTYTFHYDGGHGWLAVPVDDVVTLGIAGDVSCYSYYDARTIYLEEDCDACLFMNAFRDRFGHEPEIREQDDGEDSPIRALPRFEGSIR